MTWQAWYYDILNQLFGWSRFWKLRGRGYSVKQANILITRAKLSRKKKLEILARDNYICHICHKLGYYKEMDVDHLVALANGGTNADSNLKAAHKLCNQRKGIR